MGAWDFGPFDNDDAGDWLYDLEKSLKSVMNIWKHLIAAVRLLLRKLLQSIVVIQSPNFQTTQSCGLKRIERLLLQTSFQMHLPHFNAFARTPN
jgi:hypothetical protein